MKNRLRSVTSGLSEAQFISEIHDFTLVLTEIQQKASSNTLKLSLIKIYVSHDLRGYGVARRVLASEVSGSGRSKRCLTVAEWVSRGGRG